MSPYDSMLANIQRHRELPDYDGNLAFFDFLTRLFKTTEFSGENEKLLTIIVSTYEAAIDFQVNKLLEKSHIP